MVSDAAMDDALEVLLRPPPGSIVPQPLITGNDDEKLEGWGFKDTRFLLNGAGRVTMSGSRYAGLSGEELPALRSFIEGKIGLPMNPEPRFAAAYPPSIPPARPAPALVAALREVFDSGRISDDPAQRLRHGHGQSQGEISAIHGAGFARIPDLVVYPGSERELFQVLDIARKHDACLIPFGGGTSVTEALQCSVEESRPIVSVDMRRMGRVLWIDPVNRTACIEAGAVGRHIESTLERHGWTMGHEPDSAEFSTLGGWIATHASGMKQNRYGNIEDIVLSIRAITSQGLVTRTMVPPRESIGLDPTACFMGSEGTLGIITAAVVKLHPVPPVRVYDSVLFRDFPQGLGFLRDLQGEGSLPASVRLVDNTQFQFGQALKAAPGGRWKQLFSKLEKAVVLNVLGFDPDRMVALTLVFEGSEREVESQRRLIRTLTRRHRGLAAGAENGRRGYTLTFGIAYIRDFVMDHGCLADSFETSVPWSLAQTLCERVSARIFAEASRRGVQGRPFVSYRVTQLYETGVCIYFYFGFHASGLADPSRTFMDIEDAARDEIILCGGSLSHHHGIGKLRQQYLPRVMSPASLEWRRLAKKAFDPENLFASGNVAPGGSDAS